jgi:hypothetical protein
VYAFGSPSPVSVAEIGFDEEETVLPIGNVYDAVIEFLPEDPENEIVFWKSSKPSVAQVNVNGRITGIASGVVTISAVSMDGIKKASLRVIVGDGSVTSIDETTGPYRLKLFPNPTSGNVSASYWLDKPQNVYADVFNMYGVRIKTVELDSNTGDNLVSLSLEGFSSGVYYFRLHSSEGTQIRKLVKQK